MVRVPGSSGDAGFHRESHEDEKTTVKIDEGTTKTLEPGSPVIKKEEGSESRQSPGRSSGPTSFARRSRSLLIDPSQDVLFKLFELNWTVRVSRSPAPVGLKEKVTYGNFTLRQPRLTTARAETQRDPSIIRARVLTEVPESQRTGARGPARGPP